MKNILTIIEVIVSIILVFLILIQSGDAGIAGVWTGGGETFHTRRGVEKVIFILTIIMAVLFVGLAAAILTVK